jgi:hypothetical protein
MKEKIRFVIFICTAWLLIGCNAKTSNEKSIFEELDSQRTGLHFTNTLTFSPQFNLFRYMYFYNGSGIGAGDFNNDGKVDLFFASNQAQNKLFLNKGGLTFKDVTTEAAIPQDGGWSTGVSVVDINNDGLLDIYVCRVGQYETLHSRNQFLINTGVDSRGVPHFEDRAKEYGLDFSGFSTQAAFFDYDNDSDLDVFLMNHSVHQNNNFRPRDVFAGTYDTLSGDRIFRNDDSHFTDVTKEAVFIALLSVMALVWPLQTLTSMVTLTFTLATTFTKTTISTSIKRMERLKMKRQMHSCTPASIRWGWM